MKQILILKLFIFITLPIFSQTEYQSKSGHIFKVGDTIKLGQPVKISSSPLIATTGEWTSIYTMKDENLKNMNFINKSAIVEEIEIKEKPKVFFRLYGKKFYTFIDEGVDSGEIVIPKLSQANSTDKYDKLKKLKELLDIEAITQEEFEAEKIKILNNN